MPNSHPVCHLRRYQDRAIGDIVINLCLSPYTGPRGDCSESRRDVYRTCSQPSPLWLSGQCFASDVAHRSNPAYVLLSDGPDWVSSCGVCETGKLGK